MHYSLLSRFQGGLLGAALGAELGNYGELLAGRIHSSTTYPFRQALNNWRPGIEPNARSITGTIAAQAGMTAVTVAEMLIQGGQWQPFAPPLKLPSDHDLATGAGAVVGAIAALPLALFFHDNELKLVQMLHQLSSHWEDTADIDSGSLVVSWVITLALQNRLQPHQVIPQLIRFLQSDHHSAAPTPTSTNLIARLEQVHALLQQGSSLPTVLTTLQLSHQRDSGSGAIALALYCYLSTPTDFRLALGRAVHAGYYPSLVCTLIGAFCGVHIGITGLPLPWRLAALAAATPTPWGLSSAEIMLLSTRLLVAWAGVYNATAFPANVPAIAAPRVIYPYSAQSS